MKKVILPLLFIGISVLLYAQDNLPILRTTTNVLSVKDGDELMIDEWTIDPAIELDVYVANKLNQTKSITFYSDIDSISFSLAPREQHDFLIILNGQDTCLTRIKSGITFVKSDSLPLTHDTIPFILTDANNIIIQTILNGVDTLNLMFHTAQGAVSLTEKAVEKIANNSFDKSVKTTTWGGEGTSKYSLNNYLKIKNYEWDNLTIWQDRNTGPGADGKFGPHLFGDKVIELNFDQNIMVIHSYLPEIDQAFEKANLLFKRHLMFVETVYNIQDNQYENRVLIHSGYGGTLLLDDQFVKNNNIGAQLETISESQLQDSHGNVLKTKKAVLPYFSFGQNIFTDMPISFFEGTLGRQHISVVGGNIIKRFNIFLDLQNAQIYYKPSQLMTLPFENS